MQTENVLLPLILPEFVQALRVDYAAPVLVTQRQLQQINVERVRRAKLVVLMVPLLWTPLFIVVTT